MKKDEGMEEKETPETKIKIIGKPAGLYALKQFAQDILNAVEKYEKNVKKELAERDDG